MATSSPSSACFTRLDSLSFASAIEYAPISAPQGFWPSTARITNAGGHKQAEGFCPTDLSSFSESQYTYGSSLAPACSRRGQRLSEPPRPRCKESSDDRRLRHRQRARALESAQPVQEGDQGRGAAGALSRDGARHGLRLPHRHCRRLLEGGQGARPGLSRIHP